MEWKRVAFWGGLAVFVVIMLLPPLPIVQDILQVRYPELPMPMLEVAAVNAQRVLALLLLVVIWWITEAVPLPVAAILPAVLAPILQIRSVENGDLHIITVDTILRAYADPIIFLFLGSFLIAAMLHHRRLDRVIAQWLLQRRFFARSYYTLLFGLMLTTAILSMWLSNTAVTAMMLPLVLAIVPPGDSQQPAITIPLLLGIAWSASIGGIATIVGTPPNGIAAALLHHHQVMQLNFLQWLQYGLPVTLLLLPVGWFILSRRLPAVGSPKLLLEPSKVGLRSDQKRALGVFLLTIGAWVLVPLFQRIVPPDSQVWLQPLRTWTIGLLGGVAACVVPVSPRQQEPLLPWDQAVTMVDWGTLILFGGGLALSTLLMQSGAGYVLVDPVFHLLGSASIPLLIAALVLLLNFLTEIASNTAVTSLMVPLIIAFCQELGVDSTIMVIAAAIGASLAFMMPVATPPNALVFGTGKIPLLTMIRMGFRMNLIAWIIVSIVMVLWYKLG